MSIAAGRALQEALKEQVENAKAGVSNGPESEASPSSQVAVGSGETQVRKLLLRVEVFSDGSAIAQCGDGEPFTPPQHSVGINTPMGNQTRHETNGWKERAEMDKEAPSTFDMRWMWERIDALVADMNRLRADETVSRDYKWACAWAVGRLEPISVLSKFSANAVPTALRKAAQDTLSNTPPDGVGEAPEGTSYCHGCKSFVSSELVHGESCEICEAEDANVGGSK